jgi:hypothetical protein
MIRRAFDWPTFMITARFVFFVLLSCAEAQEITKCNPPIRLS